MNEAITLAPTLHIYLDIIGENVRQKVLNMGVDISYYFDLSVT